MEWVSTGDHPYTGIFKGGDAGIVRASSGLPVDEAKAEMVPAVGIKLLRDN